MENIKIHCNYSKLININDLRPHPDNENKHNDEQINVLADIIRRDGVRHPIIVSNLSGYICMGHGRLKAFKLLKMNQVPIEFQDFDDPIQEMRVRTADNNIAKYAEFDIEKFKGNLIKFEIKDPKMPEFGLINFELPTVTEEKENNGNEDNIPDNLEKECVITTGMLIGFDPYYECDLCGKIYTYEDGQKINEVCECSN